MSFLATNKAKTPNYEGCDADGEIKDNMFMARNKAEEKQKYGSLDKILPDILNGKLKVVQNRRKTESNTDDNEDDGGEMPEESIQHIRTRLAVRPKRTYSEDDVI